MIPKPANGIKNPRKIPRATTPKSEVRSICWTTLAGLKLKMDGAPMTGNTIKIKIKMPNAVTMPAEITLTRRKVPAKKQLHKKQNCKFATKANMNNVAILFNPIT